MKQTLISFASIFVGVITLVIIGLVLVTVGPSIGDIAYELGQDFREMQAELMEGGKAIYDKYGFLCTTTTYQESNQTCP